MSQIEKLYEAYCAEQSCAPMPQETIRLHEVLSSMLPHKEYLEIRLVVSEKDKALRLEVA